MPQICWLLTGRNFEVFRPSGSLGFSDNARSAAIQQSRPNAFLDKGRSRAINDNASQGTVLTQKRAPSERS